MENNLYYTPTIEEFHVGFEYEHLTGFEKEFKPYIYDLAKACLVIERESISHNGKIVKMFIPAMQACIEEKQCRVKFLDQSDIESLGWVFKTKGPFRTWYTGSDSWFNNTIPTGDSGRYWSFVLSHDLKYNGIIIKAGTNYGDTDTFFEGTIKNKSELVKLMQQLNIK